MPNKKNEYKDYIKEPNNGLKAFLDAVDIFDIYAYQKFLERTSQNTTNKDKTEKRADQADSGMAWVFLGCNLISLAFAVAILVAHPASWLTLTFTLLCVAWNYFDVAGGFIIAEDQSKKGDKRSARINQLAAGQLALSTTFFVAVLCASLGGTLLLASSAAASFGFAAVMGACGLIEVLAYRKGLARIKALESILQEELCNNINSAVDNDLVLSDAQLDVLQDYLKIEKAMVVDRKKAVIAWTGCFIGMTAISTVGVVTLGALTGGMFFASASLFCVIAGLYRLFKGSNNASKVPLNYSAITDVTFSDAHCLEQQSSLVTLYYSECLIDHTGIIANASSREDGDLDTKQTDLPTARASVAKPK